MNQVKEKSLAASQAREKTELNSSSKVADPAVSASSFSPDLLAVAAVIQRARQHEHQPKPQIVMADGSEVEL